MGKDKYENEDLIAFGWPDDLWFHVDSLSSAHVYVRLPEGEGHTWKDLPEQLIIECCQLVKQNSIEGCKKTNVKIVYTPWSNLKKTGDMAVGQVSFHSRKETESYPDLKKEQQDRDAREAKRKRKEGELKRLKEKEEREQQRLQKELRTYAILNDESKMESNKHGMGVEDFEDDFL
eukprot:gene6220-7430_t